MNTDCLFRRMAGSAMLFFSILTCPLPNHTPDAAAAFVFFVHLVVQFIQPPAHQ
jgi:hypothetical protein